MQALNTASLSISEFPFGFYWEHAFFGIRIVFALCVLEWCVKLACNRSMCLLWCSYWLCGSLPEYLIGSWLHLFSGLVQRWLPLILQLCVERGWWCKRTSGHRLTHQPSNTNTYASMSTNACASVRVAYAVGPPALAAIKLCKVEIKQRSWLKGMVRCLQAPGVNGP